MHRARGFTLIELIMVIVLLSIVATISVQFVTFSTQGAIDTSDRQQRSLTGVVISEQITRALREALPTSVRTDGTCIEWMPILAASNYLTLPKGASPTSFDAVPLASGGAVSGRIVVYGYSGSLYNASNPDPGVISPPARMDSSANPAPVTFDDGASHRFKGRSPEKRFYVVDEPRTLCQSGQFLYRYSNYPVSASIDPKAVTPEVMAATLQAGSLVFAITPPSLKRGAVVSFKFILESPNSDESLTVQQEVQIRNVP